MPSERKNISSEDLLESLMKSLPGLLVLLDSKAHLHWWNKRFEEYIGYTGNEIKRMEIFEFVIEQDRETLKNNFEEILEKGEADIELRIKNKEKDSFLFLITGVSLRLKSEDFIVIQGTNITDKEKLREIIENKNVLLAEVHHRIKNNLNIVSSILSMQADKLEDEELKKIFQENYNRIHSISLVHQMLYEQSDFSKLSFKPYIMRMIEHMKSIYATKNVHIETEIDENIHFDVNMSIPCSLLLQELLSNAFKHGCHEQNICKIKVSFTKEQNVHKLIVSDNGKKTFNIHETEGFGLTLLKGLTSQLGGKLDIQQKEGTSFIITF